MLSGSNTSTNATKVINASVISGSEYQLPGVSENMKIFKQASYFEVSSLGVDSKSGMKMYRYKPAKGFTGADEVTLSESKTYISEQGGCSHSNSQTQMTTTTTFIKIKFSVTN
jgi:hypothetical protein